MPKISQFPSGGVAQNTDLIPVVRNGGDYTITGYNLAALASYGQAYTGTFTATAGQTVFTLPASPGSLANLAISVDGAVMVPGTDYTWTTPTTLTFMTGLSAGQTVLYRYTTSVPVGTAIAGGVNGQLLYNNSGIVNGTTIGGDATLNASTGALTVTKTNGVSFAASATTNTTLTGNINYTQGGTGATSRTVTSKLQESVSVKDFGAVGDGSTDDTTAIQNAINAAATGGIYIPPGTYKISSTLVIKGGITGAGVTATIIQPATANFAAFSSQSSTAHAKYKISGIKIDFGVATGGVAATSTACCGFSYTGASTYDYEFTIEDVWIRCPYYGIYDVSASYMVGYRNVRVDACVSGFYKATVGGTTFTIDRCFTNGFTGYGFYFYGVVGLTLTDCAFQGGTVTGGGMFFISCIGVNVLSTDYEANTFSMSYGGVFTFSYCSGFNLNGARGYNNTYAPGGNAVYGVNVNGASYGAISNVAFGVGSPTTDVATGTGTTYAMYITDTCKVTVDASQVLTITGGSVTARGLTVGPAVGDTCTVFITASCNASVYSAATNAKCINASLAPMSADNGDANVSNLAPGISYPIQLFNTPLTTNRTVGFGSLLLYNGATFRVIRTAAATGASTLTVNSGKALAAGQWVDYTYSGSAWIESAFGSL